MAQYERNKPHVNVGTIGHFDHGKTTLTAAILKVQNKKKLAKAISYAAIAKGGLIHDDGKIVTIESAYVEYESSEFHYAHIDCPGLPEYTKNMFHGLAQMDGAILVVSALDSVQPQTLEHVILARQAGVNHLVVFLNKCDLVDDPEALDLVEMEVRELLNKYKFDCEHCHVVRGSALGSLQGEDQWQDCISELIDTVDAYIPTPEPDVDKPFLMRVAKVSDIDGRGTMATGQIVRGMIRVGEPVELICFNDTKRTTVTHIEVFGKVADQVYGGDFAGCLLRGVDIEEINRDQVLSKPGSITRHTKFLGEVYILKKEEGGRHTPFLSNFRPQFYIGTSDVTGTVTLPEGVKMAILGDNITMEIELVAPIALKEQMRFAIGEDGKVIGAGVVTRILQ